MSAGSRGLRLERFYNLDDVSQSERDGGAGPDLEAGRERTLSSLSSAVSCARERLVELSGSRKIESTPLSRFTMIGCGCGGARCRRRAASAVRSEFDVFVTATSSAV